MKTLSYLLVFGRPKKQPKEKKITAKLGTLTLFNDSLCFVFKAFSAKQLDVKLPLGLSLSNHLIIKSGFLRADRLGGGRRVARLCWRRLQRWGQPRNKLSQSWPPIHTICLTYLCVRRDIRKCCGDAFGFYGAISFLLLSCQPAGTYFTESCPFPTHYQTIIAAKRTQQTWKHWRGSHIKPEDAYKSGHC